MKLLFSFLLIFALSSSFFAAPAFASSNAGGSTERSPASVSSGVDAQETALESEIDRQADVVFKEFIASVNSRVPLSALQIAKRAAIYKLKQMHVLTDILKAAGPAPATTILATELLTNFVLAPIATAFGRPVIAGVIFTVPWGLITGFGVFSYQMMRDRYTVARSIGVSSLRSLDQIRKLVVGYDLKYRVSSVIYQSLTADRVEFEVLRSAWNFDEAKVPTVTIAEFEAMVRQAPGGPEYLEQIYLEKLDPAFYAALLLRFTNESERLTSQLVQVVRARMPEVKDSSDPLGLRRHLIEVDDIKKQLDREIRNYQTAKAGLKKLVKAGTLTAEVAAAKKSHASREIVRLRDVRNRVMRHEYAALLEARASLAANAGRASSIRASSLRVLASRESDLLSLATEASLKPPRDFPVASAPPRLSGLTAGLKTLLAAIPQPRARAQVCLGLFF